MNVQSMTSPRIWSSIAALVILFVVHPVQAQSMQDPCPDVDGDGYLSCEDDCNDNDASVHPFQSDATCNGVDNDCDGAIDENFSVYQSLCGVGVCKKYGNVFCVNGALNDTCEPNPPWGEDDNCNNKDDDCDGAVDEGYVSVSTSCGVGACVASGWTTCNAGKVTSTCTPGSPAGPDNNCDGVDDDCDGYKDEHFSSWQTSCGIGECFKYGLTQCHQGTIVDTCTPHNPAEADTACNSKDDDCDGMIDEDYIPVTTACGKGLCVSSGWSSCVDGSVEDSCSPLPKPGDDKNCDGVDDDCDGLVDEHYQVFQSTCGIGLCTKYGNVFCVNGALNDTCTPQEGAPDDATCDGKDNDCDGLVDEDYQAGSISCGLGACVAAGTTACINGTKIDECTPGTPAGSDALCDGIDDDCDGSIDEDFSVYTSSCGEGACAKTGNVFCVEGEINDTCVPHTPTPADTECNGQDDDCDGQIDEDFVPGTSTCGLGACVASGTTTCVNGSEIDICVTGTPAEFDTTCDGVDDNCNGTFDEEYVKTVTECGSGACAAAGLLVCEEGNVVDTCSVGIPGATDSTCDGIDDDCDGMFDEDFVGTETSCGVGPCASSGNTFCLDGVETNTCVEGDPIGPDTNCDGFDDDCDGQNDEDFFSYNTLCGVGACAHYGNAFCVDGAIEDTCEPGTPAIDDSECNGSDDDCDGAIDEDFSNIDIVCGIGACASEGIIRCVNGSVMEDCQESASSSMDDATCDGVDNDCDGAIDEDFPTFETSCGLGGCARTGILSCVAGEAVDSCEPGTPAAADTVCDEIDEDCDGAVDEDYLSESTTCGLGACVREGTTTCQAGEVIEDCTPGEGVETDAICDGLDEDCNGQVDEDYVSLTTACGVGACAANGTTICGNAQILDTCVTGTPSAEDFCGDETDNNCDGQVDEGCCVDCLPPACVPTNEDGLDESCDGVDDDCDGHVDEDFEIYTSSCGLGVCVSDGVAYCHDGELVDTCVPGRPMSDDDADCDDIDQDCDGESDEDFLGEPTSCGTVGACASIGSWICQSGEVVDSCMAGTPAADDSACDGIDNDCDGDVDEDYAPVSVGCGSGPCVNDGITSCDAGSVVDHCEPLEAPTSVDDTCDGFDDDCDGAVDDDFVGESTTCGTIGACAGTGSIACVAGEKMDTCFAGTAAEDDSLCNGIDDDCDGDTDEDYLPESTLCGKGVCVAEGMTSCQEGAVTDSCEPSAPTTDEDATCDGIDEDCDGSFDEDYAGEETTCGTIGACAATGSWACVNAEIVDTCTAGTPADDDSACNGIDDDCDGEVDEDYLPESTECGKGVCVAEGITSCVDGSVLDSCEPLVAPTEIDDDCDGIDQNCSGQADEGYAGEDTTCGTVGSCASTGKIVCVDGETQDTCVAGTPKEADTACDGVDEDCDGQVDEDYQSVETNCGSGVCAATGLTSCVDGATVDSCEPGLPTSELDANCDGVDQDCDGSPDDDFSIGTTACGVGACASEGEWACEGAQIVNTCAPGAPSAGDSTCDGVDDDCDGSFDEDFAPEFCESCPVAEVDGGCVESPGPGCDGCECEACVCDQDSYCCEVNWDALCVQQCDADCGGGCTAASPDGCSAAPGSGTEGAECEDCVCADDPYCCEVQWDLSCVAACDSCGGGCAVEGCALGECKVEEPQFCVNGELVNGPICEATDTVDTSCDGVDDDCDGEVDEDFEGQTLSCGTGACFAEGSVSCVEGALVEECSPGTPEESDACDDGIDNNCNGEIDEDCCGHGYQVSQGDWSTSVQPFQGETDVASFYSYGSPDAYSSNTGFEVSNHSVAMLYADSDGVLSLVMLHDEVGDGSGGRMELVVDGLTQGEALVNDDQAETPDAHGENALRYSWKWYGCCTDGMAIENVGNDLCLTITPELINGIDGFLFVNGGEEATYVEIPVLDEPFTICGVDVCEPVCEATSETDITCDGIDDDCDGMVDEDFASETTECGTGACAAEGETFCYAGSIIDTCRVKAPIGDTDRTCDGVDDDCDGETDEEYLSETTSCGEGVCGNVGETLCVEGAVVDTCLPAAPLSESDTTCDSIDDDCDGETDEDYVSALAYCGVGACMARGMTECVDGEVLSNCTPSKPKRRDKNCNNIDDDCDGQIDEDFVPKGISCGVGVCSAEGEVICYEGNLVNTCSPLAPLSELDDTCDGIDEDCDGESDEDYVSSLEHCGVGACMARGLTECVDGEVFSNCTPSKPKRRDKNCNNIDDDCDGEIDEDFVSQITECGVGACASEGETLCYAGEIRDTCVEGIPAEMDMSCDGIDNDCDGTVDEDAPLGYEVTQGDTSLEILPVQGETDAATFYGYQEVDAYSASTGYEVSDVSLMMLYQDEEGVLSLIIINDEAHDGSGGRLAMSIDGLDSGFISVADDQNNSQDKLDLEEGTFSWKWYGCCTDGVVIEDVDEDLCITVTPEYTKNLDAFAFLNGAGDEPTYHFLPDVDSSFTICATNACYPTDAALDVPSFMQP